MVLSSPQETIIEAEFGLAEASSTSVWKNAFFISSAETRRTKWTAFNATMIYERPTSGILAHKGVHELAEKQPPMTCVILFNSNEPTP
jgi:hypothetical protein